MRKNILILFLLAISALLYLFSLSWSEAKPRLKLNQALTKVLKENNLSKSAIISISIRDLNTEKIVYEKDSNLLLHPASILKAFTTPVALKVLGSQYKLETKTYISPDNNNLYLLLSADPLLTFDDLNRLIVNTLLKQNKKIINDVIYNSYSIDDIPWGVGWMWDDDNNSLMPKYNAYNINNNLIKIRISPSNNDNTPNISINPNCSYKSQFTYDQTRDITVQRKPWISEKTIYIEGNPKKETTIDFPVDQPKDLFSCLINKAIENNSITFNGSFKESKTNDNLVYVDKVEHSLIEIVNNTNKYSNNMAAETIFKIAGGKYKDSQGSTQAGIDSMKFYYNSIGAPMDNQLIVDGSGVSHNNLVQANWMSLALCKISKDTIWNIYQSSLAIPGKEGTLSKRLKELSKNFVGKTGTNAGISSIAGYLTTSSGKKYAVVIIIQNFIGSSKNAKELEDKLFRSIYEY